MKLKRVLIRNFRGLKDVEVRSIPGQALGPLTALLGDNGSGKTSFLQAVALTLSMATRRTRGPRQFSWHGFLPERVQSLGPTRVEIDVELHPEEITLTTDLFQEWERILPPERRQTMKLVPPASYSIVPLVFEKGRVASPLGFEAMTQFLGRYYLKELRVNRPEFAEKLKHLGDVFWFDQHRNLGSRMTSEVSDFDDWSEVSIREGWRAGVEQLREYLVGWWGFHTTTNRRGKDYIPQLEEQLGRVFPGTRFIGLGQRDEMTQARANDFYFLIQRDGRVYDLAEMSSGEQAVFPLVYEFVRLDISRSIVLIDELELHLHPPEQQRLLTSLQRIGPDCQFIITTHSEFLSSAIPNEHEVRLQGGTRCL